MCPRGRGQRPAPQPVAPDFVTELPAVPAGAMQLSIRAARVGDRAGASIDQDTGAIPERRCQRDFGIAADIDAVGHTRSLERLRERFLFLGTARSSRSDERNGGGERDLRLNGGTPCDIEDDRCRAFGAAGTHR